MIRIPTIRWRRWLLAATLAAAGTAALLRLALLDGWLRTVRIDGPSMAPNLCGSYLDVSCVDCGIHFRVDGEHLPDDERLVCPNCGFREIDAKKQPVQAGDTVLVDRWPLWTRLPRRWEVVAYRDPRTGESAVKRVAGLPGETIAIHRGNLYANGRLVRKSLAEFWETATLVHDDTHRPRSLNGSEPGFLRWRPGLAGSQWRLAADGYQYVPAKQTDLPAPDWLEYVHWRCDASLTPRREPAVVLDNDAYNQALARRLNVVGDLVLTCRIALPAGSELTISMPARKGDLMVRLTEGTIVAEEDGRPLATAASWRGAVDRPLTFAAGQFDAQLVAVVDGHEAIRLPLKWPDSHEENARVEPCFRIAAKGGAVVSQLRVWRDSYLLEPRGTELPWSADRPLAGDEYFVLGDNLPVSIDSRDWQPGGIPRGWLRGMVIGSKGQPP